MGQRVWDKGGCWSMEMGGRAEDLVIDVFCFFLSFLADGKFSTLGPPGMEGDSRRGGYFLCKSGVVG